MKTHRLLFVAILMTTAAIVSSAEGINLAWDECAGAGGPSNRSFACNTNIGIHVMVASFEPPAGITKLVGGSAVVHLGTALRPLPSWWQFGSGGCREGALRLDFDFLGTQGCVDTWSGAATGSLSYEAGFGGRPERARITLSWGIPEALAGLVEAGTEYYAFRLIVNNSKSVGSGSCAGCLDPACIGFTALWLYQPAGLGDHLICTPLTSNLMTWQGGPAGFCPPADGPPPFPPECGATPLVRRSWGMIKGLYR